MQLDLLKLALEGTGIDFEYNTNKVEYQNYLIENPITINVPISGEFMNQILDAAGIMPGGDPGETGVSEGMFKYIVQKETGKQFGYQMPAKDLKGYDLGDAKGHKTYGYGLLYHPISGKYMDETKSTYTQQELEQLYKLSVKKFVGKVQNWINNNNLQLNQNQIDAITSACYNFGTGFLNKNIAKMIVANPNDPNIPNVWAHLSDAQGKKYPGLIKRRAEEAAWYSGRMT